VKKTHLFHEIRENIWKKNKFNAGTSHPFDEVLVCIEPLKESSTGEEQLV
jgi:hypothetical protein